MQTNHSGPASDSAADPPEAAPAPRPPALLPTWWWFFVTLGIVASLIAASVDQALSHVLFFASGAAAVMLLAVRALFLRRWGRWRFVPLSVFIVVLGLTAALFRIDDMTGNLVPTKISLRWLPKADETLREPFVAASVKLDLRTETPDDFPQFLGPSRRNFVDHPKLLTDWRQRKPRQVWRQPIGAGWSGFAARNGYAVTMEQRGREELVTCYAILTSQLMWAHSIQARHETVPGGVGPRATPAINDGYVYAMGATGILRCLDGGDGALVWQRDLRSDAQVTPEQDAALIAWGRAGSPLIHGDWVIVPVGGPGGPTLMALDKKSGEPVWKQGNRQISYASPVLMTLGGVPQFVLVCEDWVVGHRASDGAELWSFPWPGRSNANASVSQPVQIDGERLFLSKGYSQGAAVIAVTGQADANQWEAAEIWATWNVMKTKFSNVVLEGDYVYGLDDGILSCVDVNTGKRMWKRGRYNHGQVLKVADDLLVLDEDGTVCLVELSPVEFHEFLKYPMLNGKTWNSPCLSGPYLLIRNGEEAACFELPTVD